MTYSRVLYCLRLVLKYPRRGATATRTSTFSSRTLGRAKFAVLIKLKTTNGAKNSTGVPELEKASLDSSYCA